MTDLENAVAGIVNVFQKYSEREGDRQKMKKSVLKELLHHELPDLIRHGSDQASVSGLMEGLDQDGEADCDFQEFMTLVSTITACCHQFFHHEHEEHGEHEHEEHEHVEHEHEEHGHERGQEECEEHEHEHKEQEHEEHEHEHD